MSGKKRGELAAKTGRPAAQYAALPYRRTDQLEVLLVTSRETRRWVIPKGWPMKGKKPYAAAAREALEEAGVTGRVDKAGLGAYPYLKRLANGTPAPCQVKVFALEVLEERSQWREMEQRERRWFPALEAADAVDEPELAEIIREFAAG
jgi:8-oxo-dGTP pyrophosphatase MutT (NUDIX family)